MQTELKNKRKLWYTNKLVQYNLVRSMQHREVTFMSNTDYSKCIRGIQISNTQSLEYYFNVFNFFERDYNIYVSASKYKHIPKFTLNLTKRSEETNNWFNNVASTERFYYDILLDMDFKKDDGHFLLFLSKTIKLINIIHHYGISYYMFPSGTGFQIIILNPDYTIYNEKTIKKITEQIKERFNMKYLCLNTIGQTTKIRKCPYSLVYSNVCLPLKKLDYGFSYNDIDSNRILSSERLYNRGTIIKNICNINNPDPLKRFLKINMIEV